MKKVVLNLPEEVIERIDNELKDLLNQKTRSKVITKLVMNWRL